MCLTAALTLALAAGTLGIGPGPVPAHEFWHSAAFEARGGVLGQAELWVTSHLFSTLGASILAVFLFAAGVILVTGATLAGAIRATGAGVAGTGRALRRSTDDLRATVARRPATAVARAGVEYPGEPLLPPEPDTTELVVRATHVEAPPISEPDETGKAPPGLQELDAEDDLDEVEGVEATAGGPNKPVSADDLTPQGRYRASVTDDPDFEWRRARHALSDPLDRRGRQARHRRPGAGRRGRWSRRSATSGSRRRSIGRVTGPHITRYELRLAPGNEGLEGRQRSRTISPTRWRRPTSGSSRRSPASRRSGSRCPTRAGGSCTSATCSRSRRRTGRR